MLAFCVIFLALIASTTGNIFNEDVNLMMNHAPLYPYGRPSSAYGTASYGGPRSFSGFDANLLDSTAGFGRRRR